MSNLNLIEEIECRIRSSYPDISCPTNLIVAAKIYVRNWRGSAKRQTLTLVDEAEFKEAQLKNYDGLGYKDEGYIDYFGMFCCDLSSIYYDDRCEVRILEGYVWLKDGSWLEFTEDQYGAFWRRVTKPKMPTWSNAIIQQDEQE